MLLRAPRHDVVPAFPSKIEAYTDSPITFPVHAKTQLDVRVLPNMLSKTTACASTSTELDIQQERLEEERTH